MTNIPNGRILPLASIDGVTGWTGARSDGAPSVARATIPGAKHTKTASEAGCFVVSQGALMPLLLKSRSTLQFADMPRLEVKADSSGRISGYGSVFGNVDSYKERVLPGAFAKSLAWHKDRGSRIKMLWQHRADVPIGNWDRAAEDSKGLYVEGQISLKTTAGRDAYEHIVAGDVDGLSIGYREKQAQQNRDGVRDLIELDLYEVSPVTFPGNRAAGITAAKSKADIIDLLRSGGLSKQAATLVASGGWKALSKSNQVDTSAVTRLAALIDDATSKLKDL